MKRVLASVAMVAFFLSAPNGAVGTPRQSKERILCLSPSAADVVAGIVEPGGQKRTLAGGWVVGDSHVAPRNIRIPWTGPEGQRAEIILSRLDGSGGTQWFSVAIRGVKANLPDVDRVVFAEVASEIEAAFSANPWTARCDDAGAPSENAERPPPPCPFCSANAEPVMPIFASNSWVVIAAAIAELVILFAGVVTASALAIRLNRRTTRD